MDIKKIFSILGITETKEEGLIKDAYRNQLVSVNPEDNPEGFKRLREAYESALAYARTQDEEMAQKEKPTDPVSLYLEKLNHVYSSISRRLNEEEWKKLVKEEILDDLDLGEDAKWGMFTYLASHYRLPARIWRVLDKAFGFVTDEQNFKEHLNENFVNYMCRKASETSEASEFPYHKFVGDDTAEYDVFLNHVDELVNLIRKKEDVEDTGGWLKEISQKIAFLDTFGISHPWYELEKARYELYAGKKEEAEAHIRELRENNPEDHRIILIGMGVLRDCGYEEETAAVYEDFLQWDGLGDDEIYTASFTLADIYVERGDFLKARENGIRAWNIYDNPQVSSLMEKINTEVIAQYTGSEAGEITAEEGARLAWCFLQTKRAQEGWDYFQEHPVLEEDTAECHWVKAALALECGQAQTAVWEAGQWRRFLLAEEEETSGADKVDYGTGGGDSDVKEGHPGSKEMHPDNGKAETLQKNQESSANKREQRIAQSYMLEGKGWQSLYMKAEDKESEEATGYQKAALNAFEEAIALQPEDIDFLMAKMLFERELHDYEEMAKLCERLKELDRGFYWAYFFGQEAYEGLRKAQEVVDTFYDAKKIYAGHAEIYERTVRVFWDYRQYNDVQNIIRQADEASVSSFYLTLKKMELVRKFASDEQGLREADDQAAKVIAELEEQKAPDKLLAEAYMERAYIHDDNRAAGFRDLEKMAEWANRSLELEDSLGTRYFLGRYYVDYVEDEEETAYEHLKVCEERGMTFHWMYYFIARCMEAFEEWDKAILYYKKAAEKAPDEGDFPWRIAWLYRRKFIRTGQRVYCDEALKWLEVQKEKFGENARDLWQISDIHARLGEYETALAEIEQALKDSRRGRNLGHKAKMLVMLGRAEEAPPVFEEAIEASLKNDTDYEYAYSQMEQYFEDMEDYEGAIDWFARMTKEKVITDKQRHDNQDSIRDFYIKMSQWDRALEIVRARYREGDIDPLRLTGHVCDTWEREGERIEDLLTIYKRSLPENELREACRQMEVLLEGDDADKLEESFDGKRGAYEELGLVYTNYLLEDEKALSLFQKALEQIRLDGDTIEDSDYQSALSGAMKCCYWLGRLEDAKNYGRLLEESLSKDYEECAELGKDWKKLHASAEGCDRRNLYDLFCISYFCGEYTCARQYLKQMEACRWCWWCNRKDCTELWECKGYLALLDGNKEEAVACFERAVKVGRNGNSDAQRELLRLKNPSMH